MLSKNSPWRFDLLSVTPIFSIGYQRAHGNVSLSGLQQTCRRQAVNYGLGAVIAFFAMMFVCYSSRLTISPTIQFASRDWWKWIGIGSFLLAAYFWFVCVMRSLEANKLRKFIKKQAEAKDWLVKMGYRSNSLVSLDCFIYERMKALDSVGDRDGYEAGVALWREFDLREPMFVCDVRASNLSETERELA